VHQRRFIPQVEPYITDAERNAVSEYMASGGWLTEHEKTREFEKMIAEYVGARYAVVVTSGTAALYLALLACGVGKGDAVIVPDYTMIATPNAVRWANGNVTLFDVERGTLCLDTDLVRFGRSTHALMYVSINGRANKLDEIVEECQKRDIHLIEDAAQSLGSKWKGKNLGTFGDVGIYSFTPHKIITTGQGGALVTDDKELYEKVCALKDFARAAPGTDIHTGVGFNFKFTDLQAVVGIEQLKQIESRAWRRKEIYKRYREELGEVKSIEFVGDDHSETVPWFVDVLLRNPRDEVVAKMKASGIGTRPFYPAVHTQVPYREPDTSYAVTTEVCPRGLWLPSSVGLSEDDLVYVASTLRALL
jgi:perosamine synthetase